MKNNLPEKLESGVYNGVFKYLSPEAEKINEVLDYLKEKEGEAVKKGEIVEMVYVTSDKVYFSPEAPQHRENCHKKTCRNLTKDHQEVCECTCVFPLEEAPQEVRYRFGINSTCSRCAKSDCACPQRQSDGSWEEPPQEKECKHKNKTFIKDNGDLCRDCGKVFPLSSPSPRERTVKELVDEMMTGKQTSPTPPQETCICGGRGARGEHGNPDCPELKGLFPQEKECEHDIPMSECIACSTAPASPSQQIDVNVHELLEEYARCNYWRINGQLDETRQIAIKRMSEIEEIIKQALKK